MSIASETFTLNNGVVIPKIGFGTWQIPNDDATLATEHALDAGYRHVDTAYDYRNELGVGQAVNASSIPREEIFVTTKIPASCKSYDEAKGIIEESLDYLDVEYIDLLLIHAPKPWSEMFKNTSNFYFEENLCVWKAMEEAYENGLLKSIGVSNFTEDDVQNILDNSSTPPAVNQIKYHIGYTQDSIVEHCQNHGILIEGYSPIATGKLLKNEDIAAIAQHYQKSVPQLCIRYALQHNVLPLPKSTHREYIIQNADVDFEISQEDMDTLDQMKSDS